MSEQTTVYELFMNMNEAKLIIRPIREKMKSFIERKAYLGVQRHNQFYYFSSDRKALKRFANETRNLWIEMKKSEIIALEAQIEQIENIKV